MNNSVDFSLSKKFALRSTLDSYSYVRNIQCPNQRIPMKNLIISTEEYSDIPHMVLLKILYRVLEIIRPFSFIIINERIRFFRFFVSVLFTWNRKGWVIWQEHRCFLQNLRIWTIISWHTHPLRLQFFIQLAIIELWIHGLFFLKSIYALIAVANSKECRMIIYLIQLKHCIQTSLCYILELVNKNVLNISQHFCCLHGIIL